MDKNKNKTTDLNNNGAVKDGKGLFSELIKKRFQPSPEDLDRAEDRMVFRSSRELMYDFRDTVELSLVDVSMAMWDMGYKCKAVIDVGWVWIMYDRELEV